MHPRAFATALTSGLLSLSCGDDLPDASDAGASTSTSAPASSSDGSTGPVSPPPATTTTTTTAADTTAGSTTGEPLCPPSPGQWNSYGYDASNSRHVADDGVITPRTAASLAPVWTVGPLAGVTSTPAVNDGVVYFGDWDGDMHAHCLVDGTQVWTSKVAQGINASPLVEGDLVYIPDDRGNLHALERVDGSERWAVELDEHAHTNIFSSPVLADAETLVIGVASTELAAVLRDYTFRGSVVALDPEDGSEKWRFYTTENDATAGAGVSVWSTAAVDADRGLVFIGAGNTYEEPASPLSDSLLAIDLATGDLVWSQQFTPDDVYVIFGTAPQGPDADVGGSPNLFEIDGRAVVGVGDKAGHYMVLDREDGELVWMRQLAEGSPLGGVMVTAAVGGGAVFVASNTWIELFGFGDPANTATVYALDARDGGILWEVPVEQPVFGAMTLAGGVLTFGTTDGRVVALDAATGEEIWSDVPGGDVGGGFSVVDGHLLVGHGFWFFTAPPDKLGGLTVYAPTGR